MNVENKKNYILYFILGILIITPLLTEADAKPEKITWNGGTHAYIAQAAIEMMPEPWKTNLSYYSEFSFQGQSDFDFWYTYARHPDVYRDNDLAIGSDEYWKEFARHFNDADYRTERIGTIESHPQPTFNVTRVEDRPDLSSDYALGVVEWTVENFTQKIIDDIIAGGNWTQVLFDMCYLSHYVSDAYMPFHAVTYYDGQKVPISGPEEGTLFAGDHTGIHSAVEGNLLERPNNPDIRTEWRTFLETNAVNYAAEYVNPWGTARYGTSTGKYYADLMIAADNQTRGGTDWYNTMWDACGDFYMERLLNSSIATANIWYTAFVDAELIFDPEHSPTTEDTTPTTTTPTTTTTTSSSAGIERLNIIALGSMIIIAILQLKRRKK